MKKKTKLFVTASALLVSTAVLAACGGKKDDAKSKKEDSSEKLVDTYSYVYSTDPSSLDYTFTSKTINGEHLANFVNGLLEQDRFGNMVPSVAEDWSVSKDGLKYTYKIRKGVKWVDNQGNDHGDVKAQDFVTGLKHAADSQSETLFIVADSVKGLADYAAGKIKDFNEVGVKALDDYTLEYTLNRPESFWNSKTNYGVLFPIQEEFLKEKGEKFGAAEPDSILYNGPFVLSNFTSKSVIEYTANASYWDKENVHVKNVKLTYSDGSDPDSYYKGFDDGIYTQARVFPNSPAFKDVQAKYGDDIIWTRPGGSTYNMTFNFARKTFNATSKKTDKEKGDTQKAILNKEFRQAIQFAFNKANYQAQINGKDGAKSALRNMLIPDDFVSIAGKPYYEAVEKDLKALNPVFKDVKLAQTEEGYYNEALAKEVFAKAKEALQKENVAFPIHLDLPQLETSELNVNQAKSLKKSVEDVLGSDNVVIDIQLLNEDAMNNATYLAANGAAGDFDISTASGWGPDYVDPSTYLNIYQSQTGDLLHTLGLESKGNYKNGVDPTADVKKAIHLDEYDKLLATANAIVDDPDARYTAYAKAEAWLLENVIQIPIHAIGGAPALSRSIPFSGSYGSTGLSKYSYKYLKLREKPISVKEYEEARAKWEKAKEESNKKYAEELESKVK